MRNRSLPTATIAKNQAQTTQIGDSVLIRESSQDRESLIKRLMCVRKRTLQLCAGLEIEDFVVQPIAEVSPPKWHLGHTTWFFEELILAKNQNSYKRYHDMFGKVYNSYYKAIGPHGEQGKRGNLSRPTVDQILQYRTYLEKELVAFITEAELTPDILFLIEVGIQHEQQHQELLLMDIKYIFSLNLLETQYALPSTLPTLSGKDVSKAVWKDFDEGLYKIGATGTEFTFDNERPQHKSYLYPFSISDCLVTNAQYLEFLEAGGYSNSKYWLSLGWDWIQNNDIKCPLYWNLNNGQWNEYTLYGLQPLNLSYPVVHISYFEADAFARWKNLRLPTEQEFEIYLDVQVKSQDLNSLLLHPIDSAEAGQVWCWTKSQYVAYPKFEEFEGVLNEYNGKFMCNQFVLRGGCVATPPEHFRNTYRNFYQPEQRWMFSGIRLARDLK